MAKIIQISIFVTLEYLGMGHLHWHESTCTSMPPEVLWTPFLLMCKLGGSFLRASRAIRRDPGGQGLIGTTWPMLNHVIL